MNQKPLIKELENLKHVYVVEKNIDHIEVLELNFVLLNVNHYMNIMNI